MRARDERNNHVTYHITVNIDKDENIDEDMSQFEDIFSSESQREDDREARSQRRSRRCRERSVNNHLLIDLRSFIFSSSALLRTSFYENSFEQSSTDSQSSENSLSTFFRILSFLNLRFNSSLSEFINLCIEALINVHDQEYQLRLQQLKIKKKKL